MSVVHFQCPSCQAPLRLENRALFVGRTFDCPDCHELLLIEAEGSSGATAKRLDKPTRSAGKERTVSPPSPSLALRVSLDDRSKVTDRGMDLLSPTSAWDRLSRRPAVLGWIVAAVFAIVLLVVVNSGGSRPTSDAASHIAAKTNSRTPSPAEASSEPPTAKPSDESDRPAAEPDGEKVIAKLDVPPLPEPVPVAEPPREDQPKAEPAPAEPPKPPVPPALAVLSAEAVEAKLRLKIARFDQVKPTPFVKLLETIEELVGVPIVWDLDRVDDEHLQKSVTLQLKQTTVGEILDTLLKQAGLERRIVEGKIELHPPVHKD